MHRPGHTAQNYDYPQQPGRPSSVTVDRKTLHMQDVELKERSSKSLLANVLDIDDDFRHNHRAAGTPTPLPPTATLYRAVYRCVPILSFADQGIGSVFQTKRRQRQRGATARISGIKSLVCRRRLRAHTDTEGDSVHNRPAAEGGPCGGHHQRLEIRSNGGRQIVPYYIHSVHDHRYASGAVLCATHHRLVASLSSGPTVAVNSRTSSKPVRLFSCRIQMFASNSAGSRPN